MKISLSNDPLKQNSTLFIFWNGVRRWSQIGVPTPGKPNQCMPVDGESFPLSLGQY